MASASNLTSSNPTLSFDIFLETLKYLDIPEPPFNYDGDQFNKVNSSTLGVLAVVCKDWQEPVEKIIYRRFFVESQRDFERLCVMGGVGDKRLDYIKIIHFDRQNPFNLHLFVPQFTNLVRVSIICYNNRWSEYSNLLKAMNKKLESLSMRIVEDEEAVEEIYDATIADFELPNLRYLLCKSSLGPDDYATFFGSRIRPKLKILCLFQLSADTEAILPVLHLLPNLVRLSIALATRQMSIERFIPNLNPKIKSLFVLIGYSIRSPESQVPTQPITLDYLEIFDTFGYDYFELRFLAAQTVEMHKVDYLRLVKALEGFKVGELLCRKLIIGKTSGMVPPERSEAERIMKALKILGVETSDSSFRMSIQR